MAESIRCLMTFKKHAPFLVLYSLALLGVLLARAVDMPFLEFFCKPLLMPILAAWFWINAQKPLTVFAKLILGALFFSWGGDVFLMFQPQGDIFFILGLGSFLIAHILYIIAFLKGIDFQVSFLKKKPFILIPFLAYAIGLMSLFGNNLGLMFVPVLAYSSVILIMALAALNRKGQVNLASFQLIFFGALIFISSDSMIALNKFWQPISFAGVWIMVTYTFAQYLIAKGGLSLEN